MREIIFKGKRVDNGEWIIGDLVTTPFIRNTTQQNIIYILDITKADYDCFEDLVEDNGIFEVDRETVCQCTGIEDKNGKRIFEGDIVRAIYKPKDEDLTTDDFIIKWDKYYCKYVGHYAKKENVYNPLLFGSQTSFEVIGNIFDNPELTK